MGYAKDKTKLIAVRLDPQNMAKLDALAKDAGVNRSEMLRRILAEIVTVGTVNWDSGKVKLVEGDGTAICVVPINLRATNPMPLSIGPQEPPSDPRIFNKRGPDGKYPPISKFFDRSTSTDVTAEELAERE